MGELAGFTISSPSRHPASQNSYDAANHRYRDDYISPAVWVLNLSVGRIPLPDVPVIVVNGHRVLDHRGTTSRDADNLPHGARIEWRIRRTDEGQWSAHVPGRYASGGASGQETNFRRAIVTQIEVPAPGRYEVSLHVTLADGSVQITSCVYALRDFLVVGVGDSFASGQGNPDLPAIPAPDQELWCRATTLAILAERVRVLLEDLARLAGQGAVELAEMLPFAGKLLGKSLSSLGDVASLVASEVKDLAGEVVAVVRDLEAAAVEGVEELGSYFGIGDGADSDQPQPRPARWQEPNAYRSYRSAQSLAAAEVERSDEYSADRITFLSFARTGSDIRNGLLGPRRVDQTVLSHGPENVSIDGWAGDRGQLDEARDAVVGRPIDHAPDLDRHQ